ncbi:MAG: PAS domain-containing protein, partial [Verrucomicrobiota bacterium]
KSRRSHLEGEGNFESVYRLRDNEGEYRWIEEKVTRSLDEAGRLIGFVGFCTDFTRRRLIENALRESEHRAQALADISPVGIFRTDGGGQFLYANLRWHEIADMGVEEAAEKGWTRSIHKDDQPSFVEEWGRFARQGGVFNLQYRIVRRDGSVTWVLGQAKGERNLKGEVIGCVGTLTDLTARHHLEQEQLKISKLESLGVLAGGIAHDFNNQLTPVILNIDDVLDEELPSSARDRLEQAKAAVDQASSLTQQLLTFAKGGSPVKQTAKLPDILRTSTDFALRGTNVKASLEIEEGLWPVKVDVGQMSQVVQNLVINAAQATGPSGGTIRIGTENVYMINHPSLPKINGCFVHVAVEDEGCGISQGDLKRIFDPYFTTKETGHGLGLASALSVIQQHDGHIGVTSEPGEGTIFSIFLPASDSRGEDLLPTTRRRLHDMRHPDSGKRPKIMVMDDEELIRNTTSNLLRKLNYDAVTVSNGEQAVDLYTALMKTERPVDAVLVDLTIQGGMGGKETVVELQKI